MILNPSPLLKESKLIRKHMVDLVENVDLTKYGTSFQGIFFNLDILNIDFVLNKLEKMHFSRKFMDNGLLFIWVHKTRILELTKLLESKRFTYAENLVFSLFDFASVEKFLKERMVNSSVYSENSQSEALLSYEEVIETLMNDRFNLRKGEELIDYLVKIPSEFISSNKNTLLVFRRVS